MTIEQAIKDVINQKMNDGTVETLVAEQLEKGVKNALENLFRPYGDVTKLIEDQVKSVMVPYLENYDYSNYLVKLDSVLVDVLKNSALDNKQLLGNFKSLMTAEEPKKSITVSELFEEWMKYVEKNVETDGLEINYEDSVTYENVEVRFEVDYNESNNWGSFEYAVLSLVCEHDENMNFTIRLSHWKQSSDKGWDIRYDKKHELTSLRYINEFELLLMKLTQNHTTLIIDKDYDDCEVQPEKEPEASFS